MAVLPFLIEDLLLGATTSEIISYSSKQAMLQDSAVPNIGVDDVIDFIGESARPVIINRFLGIDYATQYVLNNPVQVTSDGTQVQKKGVFTQIPLTKVIKGLLTATGIAIKKEVKSKEELLTKIAVKVMNKVKGWEIGEHSASEVHNVKVLTPVIVTPSDNKPRTYINKSVAQSIVQALIEEDVYNFEPTIESKYKTFTAGENIEVPAISNYTSVDDVKSMINFYKTNAIDYYMKVSAGVDLHGLTIPELSIDKIWNDLTAQMPFFATDYTQYLTASKVLCNTFNYGSGVNFQISITIYYMYPLVSQYMTNIGVGTDTSYGYSPTGILTNYITLIYTSNIQGARTWSLGISKKTNEPFRYVGIYNYSAGGYGSLWATTSNISFSNLFDIKTEGYEGLEKLTGAVLPRTGIISDEFPAWDSKKELITTIPSISTPTTLIDTPYIPITIDETLDIYPSDSQTTAQDGVLTVPAVDTSLDTSIVENANSITSSEVNTLNPAIPLDIPIELPPPVTPSVALPPLPSLGGAGMGTIYNPNSTEMADIKSKLWNEDTITTLRNIFTNNPLDAIMSSSICFAPPVVAGRQEVKFGYFNTRIVSNYVTNQYTSINCGTVQVDEFFNNYMDYEPYTCVGVYLPFIGIRELHANDIIGKTVKIVYRCDVVTGACIAFISTIKNDVEQLLYTFEGNCSIDLPITASSFNLKGMLSSGLSLGTGIVAGSVPTMIQGGLSLLNNITPSVGSIGSLGGNAGALAGKKPYLIIKRLKPYNAFNYSGIVGYPTNKTIVLASCKGFTKVKECHVENITCTDTERSMIYDLLTSGVIL